MRLENRTMNSFTPITRVMKMELITMMKTYGELREYWMLGVKNGKLCLNQIIDMEAMRL